MTTTFERLQLLLQPGISPAVSDAELIEQFVQQNESHAFSEIVRRHGPMVLGVCRRILHHHHDAEDAFQAVFLVLAQKADSISPRHQLPAWLYGVATRTAMKARSILNRHHAREAPLSEDQLATSEPCPEHFELTLLLDEELQRLPEKYRLPILLCELQGMTRQAVAEQLGWPEGTVAGRLHRAKQLLARRLTRRGIAVSVGILMSTLRASAVVPTALRAATFHLATISRLGDVGARAVPVTIQSLVEGVERTMTLTNWKLVTACLCLLTLTAGAGYFAPAFAQSDSPGQKSVSRKASSQRPEVEPLDPTLALQKEVQKELRLSENQTRKLKAAWEAGRKQSPDEQQKQKDIEAQIKELQTKLQKLQNQQAELQTRVRESQNELLKQAIHAHLSRQAVERLRQITLQQMDLRQLLLDRKMQARLNINDEQIKKLQELNQGAWLEDSNRRSGYVVGLTTFDLQTLNLSTFRNVQVWGVTDAKKVLSILTPEQRARWKKMVGESWPPKQ